MAKPDCEDGWFKIAVELEAALAFAGFTETARTVLRYVFLQIYGKGPRPQHAYLPQKVIADRIGEKKQNVHRAIRELVESGVLAEVRDDQYRFVKDYERWAAWSRDPARCGGPRLTPQQIKDCKAAPAYARSFEIHPKDECVSSNGMTQSSNGMTGDDRPVIQRDDQSHPTGLPESSNGMTRAIEDRARVQREKRERENTPLTPQGGDEGGRVGKSGSGRPRKSNRFEAFYERQREALRLRREQEARKEAERDQEA